MQKKYSVDVSYCRYHCGLFSKNGGQCKAIGLFIYLSLAALGLHCCVWVSLALVNRGYSQVVVCRILIAVDFLIADLGL